MANIETLKVDTFNFATGAAPATPAAGQIVAYAKVDGRLYVKDSAGNEYDLTLGGAGPSGVTASARIYAYRTFTTAR